MEPSDSIKSVRICFNGKKYDRSFELILPKSINSLKRLKDCIINQLKFSVNSSKFKIFNYKGIEIDEADIDYLSDGQILFISVDGAPFNIINYINEYELVKQVKSGGYGKVFLAKNVLSGKLAAIKQSDVINLTNEEIYNISREALYLESFRHKNIIKYINSYSYESNFYMVMQYAEGGELGTCLAEKNWLTEIEAKRVFSQLVDAVSYMHGRSVIHRDLKPNNILFVDKERANIALIDFGISGYSCGNVQEKVKAGTLKFVPPEVASGLSYTSSTKIDIWAIGIILYFMLFGVYPFDGKEDSEVNHKIIKENFKIPINIPISKSGVNLLKGLLEKNPQLRIELNSPLILEWMNDETKLHYQRKKKQIKEEKEDGIEELDTKSDTAELNNEPKAQESSKEKSPLIILPCNTDNSSSSHPSSKNGTYNIKNSNTGNMSSVDYFDEDIIREPAKFEATIEDDNLFSAHSNGKRYTNPPHKNKLSLSTQSYSKEPKKSSLANRSVTYLEPRSVTKLTDKSPRKSQNLYDKYEGKLDKGSSPRKTHHK